MIKTFKHKGLGRFFLVGERRLLDTRHINRIERMLDALNNTSDISDLLVPSYKLHKLSGDKAGVWSIKVSGNWRMTFRFENGHVYDVDLEDCH